MVLMKDILNVCQNKQFSVRHYNFQNNLMPQNVQFNSIIFRCLHWPGVQRDDEASLSIV